METQVNIPIYRGLKLGTENEYVVGFYYKDNEDHIIFNGDSTTIFGLRVIDSTTLSIHFPDMLDSQGNKIFASLQEDGKGGDILIEEGKYNDGFNPVFKPYFRKSSLSIFDLPTTPYGEYKLHQYKVIGTQQ